MSMATKLRTSWTATRIRRDTIIRVYRFGPFILLVVVCLVPRGPAQNPVVPADRFALYNECAPFGVVVEGLPDDTAVTDLPTVHLKAMAEDRVGTVGLHQADAPTFLHIAAGRHAVELRYMKPVIDVASRETEMVRTFALSTKVPDGTDAGLMLEVSRLLDLFLVQYRRVNAPACGARLTPPTAPSDATPSALSAPVQQPSTSGPKQQLTPRRDGVRWGPIISPPEPPEGESTVHKVSTRVTSPRLLHKVEPSYTEMARNAKLEGTVLLAAEVWEDGKAHNFRVLESLGMGLDGQAINAVRQWLFEPGEKDGRPVKVAVQFQVSFKLLVRPRER